MTITPRTLALLAAALVFAGCKEPASPVAAPRYQTRFLLANRSDSLTSMGYYVVLDDPLVDTVIRAGAIFVNPFSPGTERSQRGPSCHLGCVVDLRVDLYWQRRSFRWSGRTMHTPADTLFTFRWPGDTLVAIEVPYAGDTPYCLTGPVC